MPGDVLLEGFAFTGYRSFSSPKLQRIGPLGKVHLLAGPNNSGKSNILRMVERTLPAIQTHRTLALEQADVPVAVANVTLRVALARTITDEDRARLAGDNQHRNAMVTQALELLRAVTDGDGDEPYWFELGSGQQPGGLGPSQQQIEALAEHSPSAQLTLLSADLTSTAGAHEDNARRILGWVFDGLGIAASLPPVATIPAFRQIGPGGNDPLKDGHHGPGLIERLHRLQNPASFDATADQERFARITRFVAALFEDPDARIDIAHDNGTIFLVHEGRRLPLENYGTGVHEVVILAAAATVLSGHLVCIEEPEIHLHPTLQRRLLAYLQEETDNQYIIATHSAHLLDSARASVSAVRLVGGATQVSAAITPREIATLSAELGFRASDLVQANAVVWVEGPSDRTYLRHWLGLVAPELVEGVHFSIMFYGGALLAHLSPEDPSVEEFISLPRINRNFSILIDSDRRAADEEINATKRRVQEAFAAEGVCGEVWVTAGYTVENYVPPVLLAGAVAAVHPQATCTWAGEKYENPLASRHIDGRQTPVDKPAIAQAVVERWTEGVAWPLDAPERVLALAEAVRRANA